MQSVMGDCVGLGRAGQHSEERTDEASGNTVFSGNSGSCGESWLLAPNKLPDSELRGGLVLHHPLPRLCGDLLCAGTVQQEAKPASLGMDSVLHRADEHPEVSCRGRAAPQRA